MFFTGRRRKVGAAQSFLCRHACGHRAQFDEITDPEGFIKVQIAGVALGRRGGGAEKIQDRTVA